MQQMNPQMMGGQQNQMQGSYNTPQGNMNSGSKPMKTGTEINEKYKTERCRHYETHKNCALGDKCHYAHGDEELRKPDQQMSTEEQALAMKSQQWQNCNQQNMRFKQKQMGTQGGNGYNNRGGNGGQMSPMMNGGQRGGGMMNNRGGNNFQQNQYQNQGGYP